MNASNYALYIRARAFAGALALAFLISANSCEKVSGIGKDKAVNYSLSVSISDISEMKAVASACGTPENEVYVLTCVPSASVKGSNAEILEAESTWISEKRLSYDEFSAAYGAKGDTLITFSGLKQSTEYTVLGYFINESKEIVSDLTKTTFTTSAAPDGKVGTCIWHDVFVSEYYPSLESQNLDLTADVYADKDNPGVYTITSPYSYTNIAPWFGLVPEDMKSRKDNWREAAIVLDATDPEAVRMPFTDLGVCFSTVEGWIGAGSEYDGVNASVGKMKDGVITFPAKGMIKSCTSEKGIKEANLDGSFMITLKFE